MSFGIVAAAFFVGSSLYGADQQRKAAHGQMDATRESQEEDARKTAEAATSAQVAANAKLADAGRRRRTSALSLGAPAGMADSLGGGGPALAAGGSTPAARAASTYAGSPATSTALGAGSSMSGLGRMTIPTAPTRAQSL